MEKRLSNPPIVKIPDFMFDESKYKRGVNTWLASTLYRYAKEQGLKSFEYPLAAYNLTNKNFMLDNMDDFIFQCKRTMCADIGQPIMLDDFGQVADGNHRIIKAILEGRNTILAYRLQDMPEPDFVENSNDE